MSGSVQTGLGGSAAPIEIVWSRGRIRFGALEWGRVIGGLEEWLIDRALRFKSKVWKQQMEMGIMSPEQVGKQMEEFVKSAVESGDYSFGSEAMSAIFNIATKPATDGEEAKKKYAANWPGVIKLTSLMLGVSEDDAISLMAEKGNEVGIKLAMALARGMPSENETKAITNSEGE